MPYVEELNVIQDLIIVGEIIAGNDIGTRLLLESPVGGSEVLSGLEERLDGDFAGPIRLGSLLEITVYLSLVKVSNKRA